MKLIDILVEELPKRGGWPKGANCITQDGDLKVGPATCNASAAKCNDNGFWFLDSSRIGGFEVDTLASDYTTAIITREQYEAALAAKNDGWIEWGGGVIPISTNTFVDVKFNNGDVRLGKIAGEYSWEHVWEDSNIIAYRLHQPKKSEQVRAAAWNAYVGIEKANDEADLNECIVQAPVTTWGGDGLPPVGCECEYSLNGGSTWWKCKIDYIVGTQGVVMLCDTFEGVQYVQFSSYGDALKFRPIRSEADIKRHDAAQALCYAGGGIGKVDESAGIGSCWFDVYDAIAAGKIPGVKLED